MRSTKKTVTLTRVCVSRNFVSKLHIRSKKVSKMIDFDANNIAFECASEGMIYIFIIFCLIFYIFKSYYN